MGRLRVALVLATSAGGVGNHVRSLAAELADRGVEVRVLGPSDTARRFDLSAAGAWFTPLDIGGLPRPGSDLKAVVHLRRLGRHVDITHAHGLRAGGVTALAGVSPLAVTLHNAPPDLSGPLAGVYPALERVVARRADTVLGVSGDLVERMRHRGARAVERALVAAPAMGAPTRPAAEVRAELGVEDGRPVLLSVARLAPQKGLDVLLEASRAWARRVPPPLVAVAGDGPLEGELRARVSAESLPVRLLGHREDVPDLLGAADAFVLSSVWEGPSLVIMEALRAGLPVVATRVGGIPDLYSDVAVLVPPNDSDALARGVTRVLDDPELATRMRGLAAGVAARLPTESDVVEQALALYHRLAASGGAFP